MYSKRIHYSYHPALGEAVCGVKINPWSEDRHAEVTCKKCLHLTQRAIDAGDSVEILNIPNAGAVIKSDGGAVPTQRN